MLVWNRRPDSEVDYGPAGKIIMAADVDGLVGWPFWLSAWFLRLSHWIGVNFMSVIGTVQKSVSTGAMLLIGAATLAGCPLSTTVDYHTQSIEAGSNELEGKELLFMPDSSISFYSRTVVSGITGFTIDTDTVTEIDFSEANPYVLYLPSGSEVLYYGRVYDTLFIGSDGVISLGEAGSGNETLADHFSAPQVSLLPVDATQAGGIVSFEILPHAVVVTFENVRAGGASNSFQVEFFISGTDDGGLAINYPEVSVDAGGVVGLSNGPLAGANQAQIDAFLAGFSNSSLILNNTGTVPAAS